MADINGIPYVESSDLVSAYPAASQALAQEVSDQLASKLPYSYGTATPSTTVDGFLWYDENDTPPTPKFWDGSAFQALTSGKILQIVRATDATTRSTTSTSFVDVTGMSVTITPQKSTSAVLIVANYSALSPSSGNRINCQITDSSNNAISGAEESRVAAAGDIIQMSQTLVAYATPATTSATTYKLRFSVTAGTGQIVNAVMTGQMYALEIGA